ncbi:MULTISPECIES: GNAT family N-acetyltransferase [unclassified Bacillus (in: firmicutes)]|uniref:GNAT family N-acetyltransferase n=1 Tax=unclassified Bacillus (in: firmicutes) TaxID=185979 RepID=UPI000B891E70|nr:MULTISPECIES: GNAT family N-acetyltransferase [unclassified Bacillus (in: firmicutes)]
MIKYMGTPTIETERLILRKLDLTDAKSVYDHWLSDERVMDNLIKGAHKSISETNMRVAEIVSNYEKQDFCYWGIQLKESGVLIGCIDFYNFDMLTENCNVGYSLGFHWWNKGYGTEALKAIVEFGFKQMNIHKISAAHNTDNPASGVIMAKVGMKQEGTIKHMIRNAKKLYKDCAVYGLLHEDYIKNNDNIQSNILKIVF